MLQRGIAVLMISIFVLSGLSACGNVSTRDRLSKLDTAMRGYGQAIRWARYLNAHDYHLGQDGFKPRLNEDNYEGIEVTGYRLLQEGVMNPDQTEADVVAEISYFNENVGVVQKIKHPQHWWYNEELKRWMLDAALPEFQQP